MTEEHDRKVLMAIEALAHESRTRWQHIQDSISAILRTQEDIVRVVGSVSDSYHEHVSHSDERISRIERRLVDCENGGRGSRQIDGCGCLVPAE